MRKPFLSASALTIMALCVMALSAAPAPAADMTVDFTWQGTAKCFDPLSPPFTVTNVPPGTVALRFRMKDLDAPGYPHGGGEVAWSGQSEIPRGAFRYKGPCPPSGRHRYQWTVRAMDASGGELARATVMKRFPPN